MLTVVWGSPALSLGCPMTRVCSHRSPYLLPPRVQGPFLRAGPVVLQPAVSSYVGRMVGVGRGEGTQDSQEGPAPCPSGPTWERLLPATPGPSGLQASDAR